MPTDYWSRLLQPADYAATQQSSINAATAFQDMAKQQQAQIAAQAELQRRNQARTAFEANPYDAQARAAYALAHPKETAAIKQAFDGLDEDTQKSELRYTSSLRGYLESGDVPGARMAVQQRRDADKKRGIDTTDEDHLLALLDTPGGVAQAKAQAIYMLSAIKDGREAIKTIDENALVPGKIALADAQTEQAKANALKDQYITAGDGTILRIGGDGQPASVGDSVQPTASVRVSAPIKGPVGDQITAAASAAGANENELNYLHTVAKIESGGRVGAKNGSSTGVFQFHPDTFKRSGGTNINDVSDQTVATMRLAAQNAKALTPILGRQPTPGELYLAHQQGAAGAGALLSAPPEVNAIAALQGAGVSPRIARLSITGNGGTPDMTAGEFIQKWTGKFNKVAGQADAQPQAAPAAAPTNGLSVAYKPQAEEGGRLDDDAVAMVGQQYLSMGPSALQNMGQGKAGVENKNRIMSWVAKTAKEAGTTNPELVARFAQNKANTQALNATTKSLAAIQASEHTLAANADLALKLARNGGLGPTGVPLADVPINKLRIAVGSEKAKAYDNVLTTVANEYAKILTTTTGTGGGATSDSARHEAQRLLNSGMTLNQIIAAIDVAKQEAANRTASIQGEIGRLTQDISGKPATAGAPVATAQPAPTNVIRYDAKGKRIQ